MCVDDLVNVIDLVSLVAIYIASSVKLMPTFCYKLDGRIHALIYIIITYAWQNTLWLV